MINEATHVKVGSSEFHIVMHLEMGKCNSEHVTLTRQDIKWIALATKEIQSDFVDTIATWEISNCDTSIRFRSRK